jgi:hypothetical protein
MRQNAAESAPLRLLASEVAAACLSIAALFIRVGISAAHRAGKTIVRARAKLTRRRSV